MQEPNPIVSQVQEAIRRLEVELEQLKAAVASKKRQLWHYRQAVKKLTAATEESTQA